MPIVDDILSSLGGCDAPVSDVRAGLRVTAVRSRRLGLAYSFPRAHVGHAAEAWPGPRGLHGTSARRLAELARARDPEQAAFGIAAANSLLDPPQGLVEGHALDVILAAGRDRNVAVVGHFPFVERLRSCVRYLWVLELSPQDGDLPATDAPRIFPQADVVAITGSTLVNQTLDGLLEHARDKYVVLIGPTTPLSPVFLDHGVAAVCGSLVTDPDATLRGISEGTGFRYLEGLRRVILRAPHPPGATGSPA